jgi:hypothetical protein
MRILLLSAALLVIGVMAYSKHEAISRHVAAIGLERAVRKEPPLRGNSYDYELIKVYSAVAEVEKHHAQQQATLRLIPLLRNSRPPIRTQTEHALMILDRKRALQRRIPSWVKSGLLGNTDARVLDRFLKEHQLELSDEAPFVWR